MLAIDFTGNFAKGSREDFNRMGVAKMISLGATNTTNRGGNRGCSDRTKRLYDNLSPELLTQRTLTQSFLLRVSFEQSRDFPRRSPYQIL